MEELERALALVHTEILKQARLRGWCGEYESVIDEINAKLGFPALGKRLTRQSVGWNVTLSMRGTQVDIDYSISEFIQYVQAFPGDRLVDHNVMTEYTTTGMAFEESIDAIRESRPAGWLDGACNCEACIRERRGFAERGGVQTVPLEVRPDIVAPRRRPRSG